jgi:predicted secreted protein
LEVVDKSTESLAEGKKIDGAPINRYWVIRARKVGTSSIKMSYYRQWEGPGLSKKTFELTVKINP